MSRLGVNNSEITTMGKSFSEPLLRRAQAFVNRKIVEPSSTLATCR
jgi:hypothetical protein